MLPPRSGEPLSCRPSRLPTRLLLMHKLPELNGKLPRLKKTKLLLRPLLPRHLPETATHPHAHELFEHDEINYLSPTN